MHSTRFKPLIDKVFWILFSITNALLLPPLAMSIILSPEANFIIVPVILFSNYFLVAPLFGYAELRDESLFIKYGFFLKKEIPYSKIRSLERERRWYCESMLGLKTALLHVNVKYNRFDITAVSVKDTDRFICEVEKRVDAAKNQVS